MSLRMRLYWLHSKKVERVFNLTTVTQRIFNYVSGVEMERKILQPVLSVV